MPWPILALAQAVAAEPPQRIDLTLRHPCEMTDRSAEEIVVCGRGDQGRYRLNQPLPPRQNDVPKAGVQIADGVVMTAETEGAGVGGQQSNRIMARIRIAF